MLFAFKLFGRADDKPPLQEIRAGQKELAEGQREIIAGQKAIVDGLDRVAAVQDEGNRILRAILSTLNAKLQAAPEP